MPILLASVASFTKLSPDFALRNRGSSIYKSKSGHPTSILPSLRFQLLYNECFAKLSQCPATNHSPLPARSWTSSGFAGEGVAARRFTKLEREASRLIALGIS